MSCDPHPPLTPSRLSESEDVLPIRLWLVTVETTSHQKRSDVSTFALHNIVVSD